MSHLNQLDNSLISQSIAMSPDFDKKDIHWYKQFSNGVGSIIEDYDIKLVGGDDVLIANCIDSKLSKCWFDWF